MQGRLTPCLTVVIFGNPGNSLVRGFETFVRTSKRNYGDESLHHRAAPAPNLPDLYIRTEISISQPPTASRLWLRLIQFKRLKAGKDSEDFRLLVSDVFFKFHQLPKPKVVSIDWLNSVPTFLPTRPVK